MSAREDVIEAVARRLCRLDGATDEDEPMTWQSGEEREPAWKDYTGPAHEVLEEVEGSDWLAKHDAEVYGRVHFRCDCVPTLGPPHCHACEIGTPVEWADCVTVAEVGAKALRDAAEAYGHYAQANGAEIVNWLRRRAARATTTAEVGTDGEL